MFASLFLSIAVGVVVALPIILAMMFRVVVPTNEVHIVQSSTSTVSYGKDQASNSYYDWPAWVPFIGIQTKSFPVSVFSVMLDGYAAYDQGRVPFVLDIVAFFRITDSNVAAQRVESIHELVAQLQSILQGAVRSILAASEIEHILEGRSKFGQMFTDAVEEQLKAWGVGTVKSIELMDIRDAKESQVIANIMAKKKSLIEMQSRIEVAANHQQARTAELSAEQTVKLREQEQQEKVGERTAEKDRQIGIANQKAQQEIKEQERITAEKAMAVKRVNEVQQAEINRSVQEVEAEQEKNVAIIKSEGTKQGTILIAEGDLEKAKRVAEATRINGEAKGAAEQAVMMAPVNSQISLAKEIGQNAGYQSYLVSVKRLEVDQTVGVAQAEALKAAQIKVIANTGTPVEGVDNVMQLFSAKGGTQVGAFLEAVKQTDAGRVVLDRFSGNGKQPQPE